MSRTPENMEWSPGQRTKRSRPNSMGSSKSRTKRTNLTRMGNVTSVNKDRINIQLPKSTVASLRSIYTDSFNLKKEISGKIDVNGTNHGARFSAPTRVIGVSLVETGPIPRSVLNSYISYHTHPAATKEPKTFSLPTMNDINVYVARYPHMQANIIADQNGYYVIDIMESVSLPMKTLPNLNKVARVFRNTTNSKNLNNKIVNRGGTRRYKSTIGEWKKIIKPMRDSLRELGISLTFYSYSEQARITLLNKNTMF